RVQHRDTGVPEFQGLLARSGETEQTVSRLARDSVTWRHQFKIPGFSCRILALTMLKYIPNSS
ncbi:hypothetical protein A2U01_0089216, partial [Trifolium medium]|nr:hypothetical protein [Trifolium medium]